ncbi:MAG: CsbD family protein [Demequinaceae bacterium]|nr:CsbD family protein [Demequinaceae bacterium]
MGAIDKMKDVAEEVAGKTREIMGKVTGNEVMEAEGVAEQIDAEAKLRVEREKGLPKD